MIDYSPLWETMKEKNVSTYALIRDYNFSKGTLDSLKQNRNVTLNTIEMLCRILQVPIEKVVRIVYDDTDLKEQSLFYRLGIRQRLFLGYSFRSSVKS